MIFLSWNYGFSAVGYTVTFLNERATTKPIALASAPSSGRESHFALSWNSMLGGVFYQRLGDETRACYICKYLSFEQCRGPDQMVQRIDPCFLLSLEANLGVLRLPLQVDKGRHDRYQLPVCRRNVRIVVHVFTIYPGDQILR